jgi:hypothetical protein
MKAIIAIAVALSLSACGSMQTNPDGGVTSTNLDGSVCTYVGLRATCKSAFQVSEDKFEQNIVASAAKAKQQRQEEEAASEQAQQAEAAKKAEADRIAAEAWNNSPEGRASAADWEAKQAIAKREYAMNDAAKHISIYKKMMADLRAQQKREYMVEEESGGVVDMNERYRIANDIVGLNEWIDEAWKEYKASGGKAKSIADIA